MRGWSQTQWQYLAPNDANVETSLNNNPSYLSPTATGFNTPTPGLFTAGNTFVYVAIRRGPMRTPTVGTSVFNALLNTGTDTAKNVTGTGWPVDLAFTKLRNASGIDVGVFDRLRGVRKLFSSALSAESTGVDAITGFDVMNGMAIGVDGSFALTNRAPNTYVYECFRRAPGFFDEVCFTGTGSTLVLNHNLTVAPELIIGKRRTGSSYWILGGNFGASTYWYKNDWGGNDSSTSSSYSGGLSFGAQPTSTTVTLDNNSALNISAYDAVLWMWATVAGVSKVGTYTGTGALQTINCGFATGARFVLVTRVGVVGDNTTYIYDSARGIIPSNDPYFSINSTAAEVTGTDYIDTTSVGFDVTAAASSTVNVSGGSYIFLAIA